MVYLVVTLFSPSSHSTACPIGTSRTTSSNKAMTEAWAVATLIVMALALLEAVLMTHSPRIESALAAVALCVSVDVQPAVLVGETVDVV